MTQNISNKIYLIIGGTGGIGKAMVEHLIDATTPSRAAQHSKTLNTLHSNSNIRVFATYYRRVPDIKAPNLHWLKLDVGVASATTNWAVGTVIG